MTIRTARFLLHEQDGHLGCAMSALAAERGAATAIAPRLAPVNPVPRQAARPARTHAPHASKASSSAGRMFFPRAAETAAEIDGNLRNSCAF